MNTNDTFKALVRDLHRLTTEAYRWQYTDLTRRVNEEGGNMTTEEMHIAIFNAHNNNNQEQQ